MPSGEGEKALGRIGSMSEVRLKQTLDALRRVFGLHVGVDQLGDGGVAAEAAADMDVIALDLIVLADRDLGPDEADVADVMLGAGVRAAGQVDVDRLVEGEPHLDMLRNLK